MAASLIVFKHISDMTQLQHLFSELVQSDGIVYVKESDQVVMQLKAHSFDGFTLICNYDSLHPMHQAFTKGYNANFYIGSDTYYFEASGSYEGEFLKLEIKHLFFLQKRKHVRHEVPEQDDFTFQLEHSSGPFEFKIKDLSTQGLRLSSSSSPLTLNLGEHLKGHLNYNGVTVPTQARVKSVHQQGNTWTVGIEFVGLENITELFLIDRISDFQRRAFLKKNAA